MVGRIRLAWWRERLEEIDVGVVPAEPQLEAIAELIDQTSLTGAMLAELPERWEPLLDPFPWSGETIVAVAARGDLLFEYAAIVLGPDDAWRARLAGSIWSLVDVARHCSDEGSREALIDHARHKLAEFRGTTPAEVRPLTMLGLLARRDVERWPEIEPEATPGRAWMMIRHKLTGNL